MGWGDRMWGRRSENEQAHGRGAHPGTREAYDELDERIFLLIFVPGQSRYA